jgi:hypothetical protein
MAAEEIHLDDIGTVFKVLIKDGSSVVDVSTASTKELIFLKPDCTKVTQTASFFTDGSDGYIQYTSVSGDIDLAGVWKLQAHLVIGGLDVKSDISPFRVYPNL